MYRWIATLLVALMLPTPGTASPVQFGVNTKFQQGLTSARMIDLIIDSGVSINRDVITWQSVEAKPNELVWTGYNRNVYEALNQRGIKTDVVLLAGNANYEGGHFPSEPATIQAFARFAGFVATQLRGQTVAFEISNEWKPTMGATRRLTMVDYVNLFVAAAQAIHAADPSARVVADPAVFAGLPAGPIPRSTSVIGAAIRRGLQAADGVVVHQYPYQRRDLRFAAAQRAMVAAMTRRAAWLQTLAGRPMPLYVTEFGWPMIDTRGLTSAVQAAQLRETALSLAKMDFVRLAVVYELADSCVDPRNIECTFGLHTREPGGVFVSKPAKEAFRSVAEAP